MTSNVNLTCKQQKTKLKEKMLRFNPKMKAKGPSSHCNLRLLNLTHLNKNKRCKKNKINRRKKKS